MTGKMFLESPVYRRLLDFAQETDYGFALLIVKSWRYDQQTQWHQQLEQDLRHQGITLVTIEGKELPTNVGEQSISRFLQKHLPISAPFAFSLTHLEELTRPVQIPDLVSQDGISVTTRPASSVIRLNVERNDLVKTLQSPLILWVSPATARQLAESAPDFYDLRKTVLTLPEDTEGHKVLQHMPPSLVAASYSYPILPKETIEKLSEEVERLRFLGETRHLEQSRLFISMLTHLANSHGVGRGSAYGLEELQEALAEAQRVKLTEEQARLHFQLGVHYAELAQWQFAKTHYEKALNGYRNPAIRSEETYQQEVVQTSNRLANSLVKLGDNITAKPLYIDALDISRTLVKQQKVSDSALLAQTLNNLALLLANQGDIKNAKSLYKEALKHYRLLGVQEPLRYRPQLAHVLNNFANLLADLADWENTMPLYEEALSIRRILWQEAPTIYQAELAMSLQNQALFLAEQRRDEVAQTLYEEALMLYKPLVKQHPAVYCPELAMILFNYGLFWQQKSVYEEAKKYYQKAQAQFNSEPNQENSSYKTLCESIKNRLMKLKY
jgi:hypothetical protein